MKFARTVGILFMGSVVGLFLFNSLQLRRAADAQRRTLNVRFQRAIVAILQTAHAHQDDLLMQGTLQALGETPGITMAAVINENGLVVAHSQPAQIGMHFHYVPQPGLSMIPLKSTTGPWGQFILIMSDTSVSHLWKSQIRLWIFETLSLGIFVGIAGLYRYRIAIVEKEQARDLAERLQASEQKRLRLSQESEETDRRWRLWLSESVERFPGVLVLLDQRQKVVCMNRIAAHQLRLKNTEASLGKSWLELPMLQEYGAALEKSVYAPGVLIGPVCIRDLTLTFCTFNDAEKKLAGTWIGA